MNSNPELESLDVLGRRLAAAIYPNPSRRLQPRSRLTHLVGLTTAAAITAALLIINSGTSTTPAAQALDTAASAAARTPLASPLRAGQLWYTRTIVQEPVPVSAAAWAGSDSGGQTRMSVLISRQGPERVLPVPGIGVARVLVQTWVSVDGTTRTRLTPLDSPRFVSSSDRALYLGSASYAPRASQSTLRGDGIFPAGAGLFSYRQLLALPATPRALYTRLDGAIRAAQLRRPHGVGVLAHESRGQLAVTELTTIAGLLDYPLPPTLRAGLYRALALVPGTHYDGTTYDLSRRAGIGISIGRLQLIFNPTTGELLGQRSPGPGGETILTAVEANAVVDARRGG